MAWCDTTTPSSSLVPLMAPQEEWTHELRCARQAVRQAGQAVMEVARHYARTPVRSAHRSVVTDADIRSDHILCDCLHVAFPDDGWLSQTHGHEDARLEQERIWIVDALGGTLDLVQGRPEYAISVALIKNGQSQVAIVYNPCTQELFEAVSGRDARLNGIPIHCTSHSQVCPRVLVSRTDLEQGRYHAYRHQLQLAPCGSMAYRLACVAAGRVQGTLCVTPKHEWDIAAGTLLVTCAGGRVTDLQGQANRFNRPRLLVNGVVAAASGSYAQVAGLVRSIA